LLFLKKVTTLTDILKATHNKDNSVLKTFSDSTISRNFLFRIFIRRKV